MKNNFGPKKRESLLEKALDNMGWIAITVFGNGTAYGKIKEIKGREIILNPHRAMRYDRNKDCNLWKFINKDSYLEVSPNGYYLEPMTKETMDYLIRKNNEEILKNKKSNDEGK